MITSSPSYCSNSNNSSSCSVANSRSCSSSSSLSEYLCNSSWLDYAIDDVSVPDFGNYDIYNNINDGADPSCSRSTSSSSSANNNHDRFIIRFVDAIRSTNDTARAVAVSGSRVFTAHQSGDGRHFIQVWIRREPSKADIYFSDSDRGMYGIRDAGHKLATKLPTARERFTKSLNQKNYVQIRRHHKQLWIQHADAICSLAVDDSRRLLFSGSWDKTVKVWDTETLRCVESIPAHDDAVNAMTVSQQGFLYTASADGSIKVWRQRRFSKKLKHVLVATLVGGHKLESAVNAVVLSDDGEFLYSAASDGGICIWGKSKGQHHMGKLLHRFQHAHRLPILCLSYCKTNAGDRLLFSGSADKTIKVWSLTENNTAGGACRKLSDGYSASMSKSDWIECDGVLEGNSGAIRSITISDETATGGGGGVTICSSSNDGVNRIWWLARVSSS